MDDLTLARAAAAAGADIVADWATRLQTTDYKGPVDPVTAADRESEAAILGLLAQHRPDDAVVAEEGSGRSGTSGRSWSIDPLDGTVNFVHGFPQVAVSVALQEGDRTTIGVVRDVFRGEEFVAELGGGAHLDGTAIGVSGRSELGRSLVSTGFPYDRDTRGPEYARIVGEMLTLVQGIRRGGSAALDLAWVACGRLDGHWEVSLGPWDVAAGLLLVTEAGGTASAIDGGPATHRSIVAATPGVHEALRSAVHAAATRQAG